MLQQTGQTLKKSWKRPRRQRLPSPVTPGRHCLPWAVTVGCSKCGTTSSPSTSLAGYSLRPASSACPTTPKVSWSPDLPMCQAQSFPKEGLWWDCFLVGLAGCFLAAGFTDGSVYILDAISLQSCCEAFRFSRGAVTHISFSHDSEYLATAVSLLGPIQMPRMELSAPVLPQRNDPHPLGGCRAGRAGISPEGTHVAAHC